MKLETFFEKFGLLVGAPDAVAKMRVLVLRLAVMGELVAHDDDEPVSALTEQIEKDRSSFVEKRKLSRQRIYDDVSGSESPFALPRGWAWTRLGALCRVQAGFAFSSAAFVQGDSGIPIIRIRDIANDHTQVNYVGEYREEFLINPGDYLVGMDGNFAVAKWRGPQALLNQRVSRLQWYSTKLEPKFFAVAAQHRLTELQGKKAYTTVDHLSSKQIENAVVPLPPLAEQKRIVAKVNELMVLCDRLEAQQQEREARHAALSRASLARFAEAPTPANLEFLFHNAYDISPADLRKSILSLAVQGKLISGRSNWKKTTLKKACLLITDGEHATPERTASGIPLATAKNVRDGYLDLGVTDYVAEETARKCWRRCKPRGADVLMVCVGATTGRVCLLSDPPQMVLVRSVALLRADHEVLAPAYLDLFLRSPLGQGQIWGGVKQNAQPCLYLGKMSAFEIALPTLAEQHRIVAKVDELMALVDKLEAQLGTACTTAANLLSAAVAELTRSRQPYAAADSKSAAEESAVA